MVRAPGPGPCPGSRGRGRGGNRPRRTPGSGQHPVRVRDRGLPHTPRRRRSRPPPRSRRRPAVRRRRQRPGRSRTTRPRTRENPRPGMREPRNRCPVPAGLGNRRSRGPGRRSRCPGIPGPGGKAGPGRSPGGRSRGTACRRRRGRRSWDRRTAGRRSPDSRNPAGWRLRADSPGGDPAAGRGRGLIVPAVAAVVVVRLLVTRLPVTGARVAGPLAGRPGPVADLAVADLAVAGGLVIFITARLIAVRPARIAAVRLVRPVAVFGVLPCAVPLFGVLLLAIRDSGVVRPAGVERPSIPGSAGFGRPVPGLAVLPGPAVLGFAVPCRLVPGFPRLRRLVRPTLGTGVPVARLRVDRSPVKVRAAGPAVAAVRCRAAGRRDATHPPAPALRPRGTSRPRRSWAARRTARIRRSRPHLGCSGRSLSSRARHRGNRAPRRRRKRAVPAPTGGYLPPAAIRYSCSGSPPSVIGQGRTAVKFHHCDKTGVSATSSVTCAPLRSWHHTLLV